MGAYGVPRIILSPWDQGVKKTDVAPVLEELIFKSGEKRPPPKYIRTYLSVSCGDRCCEENKPTKCKEGYRVGVGVCTGRGKPRDKENFKQPPEEVRELVTSLFGNV